MRLPCPFCESRKLTTIGGGDRQWVECLDCGASGPITSKGEMEAERLWHTRPTQEGERDNG